MNLQLDDHNARQSDVVVYAPRPDMTRVLLPDAVRLLIEVAGESLALDPGDKALAYARVGIFDYWVVDLEACVIHVHSAPSLNGYASRRVVRFSEPLVVSCRPAPLVIARIDSSRSLLLA